MDEHLLVTRAREGDEAAFTELVQRHRSRALGWAKSIMTDHHIAEDVVQEALIRAFVHLGKLVDISSFLPWLQRIVRNQALNKVNLIYRKMERNFSDLASERQASARSQADGLDSLLNHLAKPDILAAQVYADPEQKMLYNDLIAMIQSCLSYLSRKERAIFEAHFYQQLSAKEIADLLETTTANVYMSLSRSRQKLMKELNRETSLAVNKAKKEPSMRQAKLKPPQFQKADIRQWNWMQSFVHCTYHLLQYAGKPFTLTEVTALFGAAFQINVKANNIDISGPGMFDWDTFFTNGLANLGFHSSYLDVYGFNLNPGRAVHDPEYAQKLMDFHERALYMIRQTVDRGYPAIVFDVFEREFALVYGYEDRNQKLYAADGKGHHMLDYARLGRGKSAHLYVIAIDGAFEIDAKVAIRRLMKRVVMHARGSEETFKPAYVNGLEAYDAWINTFLQRTTDELGNAANLLVVGDGRSAAGRFFREWGDSRILEGDAWLAGIVTEIAGRYEAVVASFDKLRIMFPYPAGGTPKDPVQADTAAHLLQQAKKDELTAIEQMEAVLQQMDIVEGKMEPEIVELNPFHAFHVSDEPPVLDPNGETQYEVEAVFVFCHDLKQSIHFYSRLFDVPIMSGSFDSAFYVFRLPEGPRIVLHDLRCSLERPRYMLVSSDIRSSYDTVRSLGCEMPMTLEKTPIGMYHFVYRTLDGHNILIASKSLAHYPSTEGLHSQSVFKGCDPGIEAKLLLNHPKPLHRTTEPLFNLTVRDASVAQHHLTVCGLLTHRGTGSESKEFTVFTDPDGHRIGWRS
ncbi:sigma-70 family RNA polymerase sigma factor [Paenibacillus sp. HJGM_3]|uniref:sigma-70 family RNA polymerase sigma factor n=1 Tax=Paenibacillus sp. HJGM_3 TaxID=3379816 RepID=UPI00385EE1D3